MKLRSLVELVNYWSKIDVVFILKCLFVFIFFNFCKILKFFFLFAIAYFEFYCSFHIFGTSTSFHFTWWCVFCVTVFLLKGLVKISLSLFSGRQWYYMHGNGWFTLSFFNSSLYLKLKHTDVTWWNGSRDIKEWIK